MRLLACLIVAPQRGYDEPAILSYAISSFCPTSADGLQWGEAECASIAEESQKAGACEKCWEYVACVLCPKTDRRDKNGHVADRSPPSSIDIAGQSASSPAVPTSEPTSRHAVEAELTAKFRSNPSLLAAGGGIAAIGIRGVR